MNDKPDYTPKSNEAEWHITYKCDLNCPNCNRLCFLPPTTPDMTLDDAWEFNRQARELGWFPRIVILGGEPTLHRDLFAFIDIANELSPGRVEIWSNGYRDAAKEQLERIRAEGKAKVCEETIKADGCMVLPQADFFLAPTDFGVINHRPCHNHAAIGCGISVDAGGYANCRAMFCHTPWYADLIRKHRGPDNQSEIVLWPYPIDPWPGEPLPDAYDLLIYAKNGHRPQLLEHLAEVFPRHVQIHYGSYRREELFEAARRSRACAYLADDDHGPLALQEILLAGCPTVGVRTGAAFVQHGETGVWVERLPPGAHCAESDDDVQALSGFMEAIEQAQAMDRDSVRERAFSEFDTDGVVDSIINAVNKAYLAGGIKTAASV